MRVLVIGDFFWDRLGASYVRAFEALRHEVFRVDIREAYKFFPVWLRSRVGNRAVMRSRFMRELGARKWNEVIVEAGRQSRPNLVLILNGDFVAPETIERLKALGAMVSVFHADNPFPPHSANRPETLPAALAADYYFIWSRRLVRKLQTYGVRNVSFLAFGWDPLVFPYSIEETQPENEVVFIGGWDSEREEFLSEVAKHFRLRIWGPEYWGTRTSKNGLVQRCWQGRALEGPEAAVVMRKSAIVLNVLRDQHVIDGVPDAVIMRTFEVPGAGAFLLSSWSETGQILFPEDQTAAYFRNVDDCLSSIDRYLGDARLRTSIALQAHAEVAGKHSYVDRAKDILQWIEQAR